MICFDDVTLAYDGAPVLEHTTLHIAPGECAALMGPSGCGKSTLLNLAGGLLVPGLGTVSVSAARTAYVFQEPRLLPSRTALQNVNAVLGDRKDTLPQAREWLQRVGLSDAIEKYPRELSGGMRQRVNLARALAYEGDLLLMDEPFRGIDEDRKERLITLLREYLAGKTLLLATHDPAEAEALCGRLLTYKNKTFVP